MDSYNTTQYANNRTATHQAYKSVQSWKTPKQSPQAHSAAENKILNNLNKAAQGKVGHFDTTLKHQLSYADANQPVTPPVAKDAFTFGDVLDIANPLHHLPIIGTAYRDLTGDELHPMSQIIGGAIYGGPVGAVTGTANAISKVQTGKDLGDHALALVGIGKRATPSQPELELTKIADKIDRSQPLNTLPGNALSFVDLSQQPSDIAYRPMAEGRTAGTQTIKKNWAKPMINNFAPQPTYPFQQIGPSVDIKNLQPREQVTALSLSPMPKKQDT